LIISNNRFINNLKLKGEAIATWQGSRAGLRDELLLPSKGILFFSMEGRKREKNKTKQNKNTFPSSIPAPHQTKILHGKTCIYL
jgi:hypothetical protein